MLTSEAFTKRIVKAANGYASLIELDQQILKIVINPDGKQTVAFVAGLHGDEVAGPLGTLKFLEEHSNVTKRIIIIPLANPTGYDQHTRRNKDDEDINRHFFDKKLTGECKVIWNALKDENLALCHTLHEDPDMSSFYLYYTHNKKLAENIRELASKYFKIHNKDGDLYGDKIVDGLIALPHKKSGTIEDRMLEYGVPSITTETPGKVSLIKRVNFTKEVMKMVSSAK